ncbi:MAG: HlyD family efflux transporter periplasmic adaptor subunit, partial [Pseudomonadota bacterium]
EALEKEKSAEDILVHTNIISPQNGIVVGLKVHTIGGVVKPGETIMDIVPSDENLIIEARVKPVDIDVVHKGLLAKVNLIAFKTRHTPSLSGKVTHVSADAFIDDKTGETYYTAEIAIPPEELERLKSGQELYPGMPVQALIITDRLTPWQYFITPIEQSFDRAFRED